MAEPFRYQLTSLGEVTFVACLLVARHLGVPVAAPSCVRVCQFVTARVQSNHSAEPRDRFPQIARS